MSLIIRTEQNVKLSKNPITNPTPADIGTVGILDTGLTSEIYQKVGVAHTAWKLIKTVASNAGFDDNDSDLREIQFLGDDVDDVALSQKYAILSVTQSNLESGRILLPSAPNTAKPIQLFPSGGPKQILGQAFGIDEDEIVIDGYGFQGVLQVGDIIEIYYY